MNSENVKQFMIIKYYNCKMICSKNNNFIKSWNIMNKTKDENRDFNEYKDILKLRWKEFCTIWNIWKPENFDIFDIYL